MIQGMTGFGQSQISVKSFVFIVEIKSVNHRYLDINYYLPTGFGAVEDKIRQIFEKEMERGRVTVGIKIIEKPLQAIHFNKAVVKEYIKHGRELEKEFGLKNDLSLSNIVALPGVFEIKESFLTVDEAWPTLEKGLRQALSHLVLMRRREGKSLLKDIMDKLRKMTARLKMIQVRTRVVLQQKKKELGGDEFSSFQKGNDINEEISRLTNYIDELKNLLKTGESTGKRIDFIGQEMQRETNTIGSKVQDKIVSSAVIALKSKIEKIREQAQNVQ